jgi:hypothetical protein
VRLSSLPLLVILAAAACQTPSPCAQRCTDLPAAECVDGQTLRTWTVADECKEGCSYLPHDQACAGGCAGGACVGGGPDLGGTQPTTCEGVTCNRPPSKTCADAQTLRIYETSGTCSDGVCSYPSRTEACAGGCANHACVNDPCQGVTCNMPPAARCLDANTLVVPSPAGSCAGGTCRYAESYVTCPFGCDQNACINDPCAGKTCNQPPATFCLSATTRRTFQTAGTCSGGSCLYAPTDETCTFGCQGGACANDPCQGKVCNTPPAAACLTPHTLRTFAAVGTCSGGSCLYAPMDMTCAFGCESGACKNDPCAGVACNTPPATSCLDPTTLRTFAAPGSCAGGACTYLPRDSTCPFGCAGGACANDPCQGVTCNQPPAAACVAPNTLRSLSPSGMCNGGACSYTPADTSCQFGCSGGRCLDDPCAGVTCNQPPARTCVGGAARVYAPSGTCQGGTCTYGYTDTPCANGCANGVCNPPACGGVTCNASPAATCTSANRLRAYFPVGTCAVSLCNYTAYDIDCSQGCINGACIAGSWTLESTPYGSALDNGNGVLDGDGEPVLVGCQSGSVRIRRRTAQGWKEEVIDTAMGSCEARVTLDANGEPMVAYTDAINRDLRFALRNGGSWSPKELVANSGDVGRGLSLAVSAAGIPLVSYQAPGEVRLASRINGTWSEETIPGATGASTELRIDNGEPVVFVAHAPDAYLARKQGGQWSVVATPVGPNTLETLHGSLLTGGAPRLLLKGTNPLTGAVQWTFRTILGDGHAMQNEALGTDVPQALRADGPLAIYARRPGSGSSTTPVIRVHKNGAWEQLPGPVPWGTQLSVPMLYTGGTRHVLVDTYARRLLSPPGCTPACTGRACGDDGCGGSCGTCGTGSACAPTGECAALNQSTVTGFAPSRAALGGGPPQALESSYSAYVPLLYRAASGGVWQAPASIGDSPALGSTRLIVDGNGVPHAIFNGSIANVTGAHVASREAGGAWATELVSTTQGGSLDVDQTGTLYFVQCSTSAVTLRTRAPGGSFAAASPVYNRPSGYDSTLCGTAVVSATGVIALPMARRYWVGSPVYDYRYDRGVLTNASGSFEYVLVASNLTSYQAGDAAFDGAGDLHLLAGADYRVRPPAGAFAVEALPEGFAAANPRVLAVDATGAFALGWSSGSGATRRVHLSIRSAPGTFTTHAAPALAAVDSGQGLSFTLHGLAFDASNRAFILVNEGDTYRSFVR